MPRRFYFVFLALILTPGLAPAADDLAARIEAIIKGPEYRHARWGILVVDSKTGEQLYSLNADQLFRPASTTKLYSCTAALVALGPDHKFETPVYARGALENGRLQGDLILVAQGDLTFGGRTDVNGHVVFKDHDHTYANGSTNAELTDSNPLAGLQSLAAQVKAAGIRQVTGDVLVDDRLFARARGSGSGPDVLSPIIVNDNVIDLIITPDGEAGKPATVRTRPETAYAQMDAQVTTSPAGSPTRIEIQAVGPRTFSLRGQVAAKGKPLVQIYAVGEPAEFARALFIECLRREGVRVAASLFQPSRAGLPDAADYARLRRVATFVSPPLADVIKVTLKVSHNLYASTLPLLVAARHGKKSLAEGLREQRKILADCGVDSDSVSFGGGAGGASADAVTPRATVQLLQGVARRPEYAALHAGLPVLGVDGTLAEAVPKDSPAAGKVFAKTGTLAWRDLLNDRDLLTSKALAGTMTTARGRNLTVALYVNDVPLPKGVTSTREGKTLGRLCEVIYQAAP